MIEISIKSPPQLQTLISNLDKAKTQEVGELAGKMAAPAFTRALVEQSQAGAGGTKGRFSAGWLAQPDGAGISVTNTDPRARVIELPTKPHIIKARPGTHTVTRTSKKGKVFSYQAPNMLAWMPGRGAFSAFKVNASTKAGQVWRYAKQVHHPGTAGKGIFQTTILGNGSTIIFNALATAARTILGA